jgi:cytosine/adenosine deaminase-related metal-dependent hydrolase
MVLKGATAAYDLFFEFPQVTREGIDAITRGCQSVGLRAVVTPIIGRSHLHQAIPGLIDALPTQQADRARSFKLNEYQSSIEVCRDLLANWPYDRSQVRRALAPTVPLHCSDPFITACGDLAEEFDVELHMHLAESKIQAVSAMQRYGKSLTAHPTDLNFLRPRFTAAHFVWADADDISRITDAGCSVSHNPGSHLRLRSGIAPARAMREQGPRVGIGTDGSSCSDNQNMFEAMRIGAFPSRVVSPDPETWISTENVIDMATRGGAAVLGFEKEIG